MSHSGRRRVWKEPSTVVVVDTAATTAAAAVRRPEPGLDGTATTDLLPLRQLAVVHYCSSWSSCSDVEDGS